MTSSIVQVWTTNCTTNTGTGSSSCAGYPDYATPYFDMDLILYNNFEANNTQDGYVTESFGYYESVICIDADMPNFCTSNSLIYASDHITQNNWNYGSSATAGIIGLGTSSPVWAGIDLVDNKQIYCVQFSNNTDWTFADSTYAPVTEGNSISLGSCDSSNYTSATQVSVKPYTLNTEIYDLAAFGFGQYNSTSNEEYFADISNDNEAIYGTYTNTFKITLDVRGMALPTYSYASFDNLMAIATSGASDCARTAGGYCVLPFSCDQYPTLWEYSFKIVVGTNNDVIIVPLASFAADRDIDGEASCAIYVEMLDESIADSRQIVFGNMFFQSIAVFSEATVTNTITTSKSLAFAKNINALDTTFVIEGSAYNAKAMSNVFVVVPSTPKIDGALLLNGLPTIEANILHGYGDVVQYFFMDFHSERNMVFNDSCVQEVTTPYAACSGEPTNVVATFTNVTEGLFTFTDE